MQRVADPVLSALISFAIGRPAASLAAVAQELIRTFFSLLRLVVAIVYGPMMMIMRIVEGAMYIFGYSHARPDWTRFTLALIYHIAFQCAVMFVFQQCADKVKRPKLTYFAMALIVAMLLTGPRRPPPSPSVTEEAAQ